MDLYCTFLDLPTVTTLGEFTGVSVSLRRKDFLTKASDGNPVFLLHDASAATYTPGISLKNVSVQFHSTCRVTTKDETLEDQFAVVSCNVTTPELHELFIRCFAAVVEQLPNFASTRDLAECVQELLDLFKALNRPNSREVTGLWAELFVMFICCNIPKSLENWHGDQFERFDFSWPKIRVEVKASTKDRRIHDFSMEQLRVPVGGKGYVASLLLQPLSGGVGIMDLARELEKNVGNYPDLKQKLWRNVTAALGSDFSDKLDRRFDPSYAAQHLTIYSMSDVPAPDEPQDDRITNVRFRVDLSSVHTSLGGTPVNILAQLFV